MLTKARELETVTVLPGAPLKAMSAPRMSTMEPPLAKRSTPLAMASVLPLARLMKSPTVRRIAPPRHRGQRSAVDGEPALVQREDPRRAVERGLRGEIQGIAAHGERGAVSERVGPQGEKRRARLQEGNVDGDQPGRGHGRAGHIEERAARLDGLFQTHHEAARRIEGGGGAREVKERSRGRDLMRPARDGDEGRRRAGLDDAAGSGAEDEIVRRPDRGVHGLQEPAVHFEGALAGRHESLGARREKEAPAVEVGEGPARGIGDDGQAQCLEESAPGQETDGEGSVREVEQRGGAGASKGRPRSP